MLTVLALSSCHHDKKWAGTYGGPITQFMAMPGAQPISDRGSADVVVTEGSDNRVTVAVHGCVFEATRSDVEGPTLVAIARSIDCTFPTSDVKFHVASASLTLTGETLTWTWMGDAKKDGATGSFGSTFAGTRAPQ